MSENTNKNNMFFIIIFLLIWLSVWSFFVWKNIGNLSNKCEAPIENDKEIVIDNSSVEVVVIDDSRCTNCFTQEILEQLKTLEFLEWVNFSVVDFMDEWVSDIMQENWITKLPAILFNTNSLSDKEFVSFLQETNSWLYSLDLGAQFDPFASRSDRWFTILEEWILNNILSNSYFLWDNNSELLWVEYSDLNCSYCKKLHDEWTHDILLGEFWDKLSYTYNYFPVFNQEAPKILECIAEQNQEEYYNVIKKAYLENKTDKNWILSLVKDLNLDSIDECLESWKYDEKINLHMELWSYFWVTWTPSNIIINTVTWEFEKLPWAYPIEEFRKVINSLSQ